MHVQKIACYIGKMCENETSCNICKTSQRKVFNHVEGESSLQGNYDHNVPTNILRDFPLIL